MKRVIVIFTVFVMFVFSVTVSAASGDIKGNIYSTDIVTYLNGAAVTSYNIGGRTCIDAEVLNWHYGFEVYWHEGERWLEINDKGGRFASLQAYSGELTESKGETAGKVKGQFYETDIKTTLNGREIESYNIGGRTFICAEAMACFGYSVLWDETFRTLDISKPADFYKYETNYGVINSIDKLKLNRDMWVFFNRGIYVKKGESEYIIDTPSNKVYVSPGGVTYIKLSDFEYIFNGKCVMNEKKETVINDFGNGIKDEYDCFRYSIDFSYDTNYSPKLKECDIGSFEDTRDDVSGEELFEIDFGSVSFTVNGEPFPVKALYGGKEFDSGLIAVGNEIYIPAHSAAKVLGYDMAW